MTKYEELDIENMAQADIRNVILEGDRISVEVEGVDGLLVRTVEKSANGRLRIRFYSHLVKPVEVLAKSDMTVTRVERPIPEHELPTVPGYYESAEFPVDKNAYAYLLTLGGEWWWGGNNVSEARMRELMPLTRLVPETEAAPVLLADLIDVEKLVAVLRRNASSFTGYYGDAAALIAAIDNGELDK